MGNTISEMGNIFHKKSEEYQVVNITSKIDDPLLRQDNKEEQATRNEVNNINYRLSQLEYELKLIRENTTTKTDVNSFYSTVNEQSKVNLDDHKKIHNVIHILRQEILDLKDEIRLLKQKQHDQHYDYDLDQPDVFPDDNNEDKNVNIDSSSPSPSVKEFIDIEKKLNIDNQEIYNF